MLKNVQAIAAIMETTREGQDFLGVKSKTGFETNWLDTLADMPKNMEKGFTLNPIANIAKISGGALSAFGFGAEAKGQAFMQQQNADPELIEALKQSRDNTANTANTTQGSTF